MSNRWKVAIAVSLALNLFLVGLVVGSLLIGARLLGERSEFRRGRGSDLAAAFQALPEARRQALRDIMRAQALDAAPDLREAAGARREAMRLIAAEPYDAAAVTQALERARLADGRARARIDATLASRLTELSPQERAVFARVMMRGPQRMMMRRRGGPDRLPPIAPGDPPRGADRSAPPPR